MFDGWIEKLDIHGFYAIDHRATNTGETTHTLLRKGVPLIRVWENGFLARRRMELFPWRRPNKRVREVAVSKLLCEKVDTATLLASIKKGFFEDCLGNKIEIKVRGGEE